MSIAFKHFQNLLVCLIMSHLFPETSILESMAGIIETKLKGQCCKDLHPQGLYPGGSVGSWKPGLG